jgi:hypothetical protein
MFFFEKKNQKTFSRWLPRKVKQLCGSCHCVGAKVFCFFFSKKKALSFLASYQKFSLGKLHLAVTHVPPLTS